MSVKNDLVSFSFCLKKLKFFNLTVKKYELFAKPGSFLHYQAICVWVERQNILNKFPYFSHYNFSATCHIIYAKFFYSLIIKSLVIRSMNYLELSKSFCQFPHKKMQICRSIRYRNLIISYSDRYGSLCQYEAIQLYKLESRIIIVKIE